MFTNCKGSTAIRFGVVVALVITCNLYILYYNTKAEYVQELTVSTVCPGPGNMDGIQTY